MKHLVLITAGRFAGRTMTFEQKLNGIVYVTMEGEDSQLMLKPAPRHKCKIEMHDGAFFTKFHADTWLAYEKFGEREFKCPLTMGHKAFGAYTNALDIIW